MSIEEICLLVAIGLIVLTAWFEWRNDRQERKQCDAIMAEFERQMRRAREADET